MFIAFWFVAISLTVAMSESNVAEEIHRQRRSKPSPDFLEFLRIFDSPSCDLKQYKLIKDRIFILCASDKSVRVYKDKKPFDLVKEIPLKVFGMYVGNPKDMVACVASDRLYVYCGLCILTITLKDYQLQKWLCGVVPIGKLSVSAKGEVVFLGSNIDVEVYTHDTWSIKQFTLQQIRGSKGVPDGKMVILKPNGDFIAVYLAYNESHTSWVVSLLKSDGKPTSSEVSVVYDKERFRKNNESCWSFEKSGQSSDFKMKCYKPSPEVFLLLEGNTLKLDYGKLEKRFVFLDVELSFGISSTKDNLVILDNLTK